MSAQGKALPTDAGEGALNARLRRLRFVTWSAIVIWVLAVVAGGLLLSNRNLADHLAAAATTARADTEAAMELVDRAFHEYAAITHVLSFSQELRAVLRRYNTKEAAFSAKPVAERRRQLEGDPDVARIGTRLTQIRRELRYDLLYVLDSKGIRILSSESDQPAPLLGTDLDDRDYFKVAMEGRAGRMFAISRTTSKPVFFFSAPIVEEGRPAGTVVVRQNTETVGALIVNGHTAVLLVDSNGMVVASSHPAFYLRHVSMADRAHVHHASMVGAPDADALRELYAQPSLRALAMTRPAAHWNSRPAHEAERVIDGRPYLVTSDPLKAYPEYSLVVLSPLEGVDELRPLHQTIGALLALFGVLAILVFQRRLADLARREHFARVTAALNDKLRAADQEKNRYLGIAAHDLRNPLSSMRGLSEVMLGTPLEPDQQREFLETIHRTSDEMLGLVNDLLDVAVIESGKLELRCKDQNLTKLVEQRIRHLEPYARGKKIAVSLDAAGVLSARLDPMRFGQVIDNLVSNAIKFSPSGTRVQVSVRPDGDKFAFSVQDEGPGIPAAEQKLLFRSFQKLSARPTGGEKSTGLGLAIVKKIVDAHGGTIDVDSPLGGGTRFTVTAPLAAPQGVAA